MSDKTGIEWTDATWNPIRGCSRVSAGCEHCYAQGVANRFSGPGQAYEGLVHIGKSDGRALGWNGQIRFVEERLLDPLRWKRPRRIFVNSMSDLFHENVTAEMRDRIFAVMALCPQHTFQVLTKRPEKMQEYWNTLYSARSRRLRVAEIAERIMPGSEHTPTWLRNHAYQPAGEEAPALPNLQQGVSGEETETATKRAWLLLQTRAAVRFLSAEPLLGELDLNRGELICQSWRRGATIGTYLDWVIAGGESGHGARPMHPDWARSLRDQCEAAGVPFFFKQWGEWIPWEQEQSPCWISQHGKSEDHHALFPENIADDPPGWDSGLGYEEDTHAVFQRVGKKSAGHLLDGVEHHAFPEVR